MNTAIELLPATPRPLARAEQEAPAGVAASAGFVGTAVVPVAIGALHLLSEISASAKTFLTLHTGIGPYSGKLFFGYLVGFLVAGLWALFGRRRAASPWVGLGAVLAGLVIGTALVFAPVVHWLVLLWE